MDRDRFPLLETMRIRTTTGLNRSMFDWSNFRIIGQANSQMILVFLIRQRLMLVFDQHAVHERIRYERLRTAAIGHRGLLINTTIMPPFVAKGIPADLCRQVAQWKPQFERYLSFRVEISGDTEIRISQVPRCFHKNFIYSGPLQDFLIDAIRCFETGKLPRPGLTPFLVGEIRTQACHGAIRFNEPLTRQECHEMIHALTNNCKSPFRCAHGRVLVKPILKVPPDANRKLVEKFKKNFPGKIQTFVVKRKRKSCSM